MNNKKKLGALFSAMLIVITAPVLIGNGSASPENPNWSTAVFYVDWFDVGQNALEGLPGVKHVEKGFRNFKEINTVWYDSAEIGIDEIKRVLQEAGTYRGTIE